MNTNNILGTSSEDFQIARGALWRSFFDNGAVRVLWDRSHHWIMMLNMHTGATAIAHEASVRDVRLFDEAAEQTLLGIVDAVDSSE
jgi:hypothetical protein